MGTRILSTSKLLICILKNIILQVLIRIGTDIFEKPPPHIILYTNQTIAIYEMRVPVQNIIASSSTVQAQLLLFMKQVVGQKSINNTQTLLE